MPRAFIAVHVDPPPLLRDTLRAIHAMDGPIKAVDEGNLHLTLRFLGDSGTEIYPEILAAMREACEGSEPFTMKLRGLGAFPNAQRPNVIWVATQDHEPLRVIVNRLNPLIDALNFGGDHRPWKPHLTLARIKARPDDVIFTMLADLREADFGSQTVTHISLVQSTLTPRGPIYEDIDRVALGG